jgi:hypothetical protein
LSPCRETGGVVRAGETGPGGGGAGMRRSARLLGGPVMALGRRLRTPLLEPGWTDGVLDTGGGRFSLRRASVTFQELHGMGRERRTFVGRLSVHA